jgi:hypothetical protein
MLLENLYRVFLNTEKILLQDAGKPQKMWCGIARDIPIEYLSKTVINVMSCALTNDTSEIIIIIA